MTTRAETPDEQARRIVEYELESIGFDLDANARETTLSLERRLAHTREHMREIARLPRKHVGAYPAPTYEDVLGDPRMRRALRELRKEFGGETPIEK